MARKSILATVAVIIAAVGALLVFMYARGADARASADVAQQEVLVASVQVEAGEKVEDAVAAGKFQLAQMPASAVLPGALTSTDEITDQVATATVYAGEQVLSQKFGAPGSASALTTPKGDMALSVQVTDPDRVAGFVSPGSDIAIWVTDWDPNKPETRLLLEKVKVLGVGQTTTMTSTSTDETGASTTEVIPTTILTLAVDQEEAGKAVYGSKHGVLTFTLLTEDSQTGPDEGTTVDNLFE